MDKFQRKRGEDFEILGAVGPYFVPQDNTPIVTINSKIRLEKPSLLVLGKENYVPTCGWLVVEMRARYKMSQMKVRTPNGKKDCNFSNLLTTHYFHCPTLIFPYNAVQFIPN